MINALFKRMRLNWFIATHTMGYTVDYLERVYKIYLNHDKIIHYRNGYPVYSLSTPALFSKPAANFFARSLFRTIQNKNIPNMMSFAINDVCNATCEHCSFFKGVEEKGRHVLSLDECKKTIKEAQELGVSIINFVGGEPTLRADLPEILQSVNKDLSSTILFTNGSVLTEKIDKLKQAGLDAVYVSIDSSDPKRHDKFRGKEGLFEKAIEGIQKAKSIGLTTGFSCCVTPESFKFGEFDKLIELAKKVGVHEILVFDSMPSGRYKFRKDLIDNNKWVEEMIKQSEKYNSDQSYPGVLVWAYVTSHRSVGCACGTSYFYVSPYGDIMSCDFNHVKYGSVLQKPLYEIWDKLSSMDDFKCSKWGGCKIKSSDYLKKGTVAADSQCGCN
jgi:MoaA/NifB/PqqE/SkfB family radical SAM enzyme